MEHPIFSPDGEFMTGSEWIPAPPGNDHRETNVDVVKSQNKKKFIQNPMWRSSTL